MKKIESSWNRFSRKEKICRAVIKDDRGMMLDEFFFGNDENGIYNLCFQEYNLMENVPLEQF